MKWSWKRHRKIVYKKMLMENQEKSEDTLLANPGETLCLCEQTLSENDRFGLQTIAEWPFRWRLSKHWMVPI